ncbi:MAG: hypothetical protein ACJARR_002556 [Pseudophaeobacter arcticus]|jgi:hypothetical protein
MRFKTVPERRRFCFSVVAWRGFGKFAPDHNRLATDAFICALTLYYQDN